MLSDRSLDIDERKKMAEIILNEAFQRIGALCDDNVKIKVHLPYEICAASTVDKDGKHIPFDKRHFWYGRKVSRSMLRIGYMSTETIDIRIDETKT